MKKNLFLTFCYSLVPGAGQMYQGYMKRGLSIMSIFVALLAISFMISTPIFILALPIIFAYSFFDTFNIRNNVDKDLKDEYLWKNVKTFDDLVSFKKTNKGKVIGISFIILGVYLMVNTVVLNLVSMYNLEQVEMFVRLFLQYFPPVLIAISCVYIGIKLIDRK
ncbi:MAG: hypothetical protein RSB67_03290 [Clostridia bacterium]